MRAWLIRFVSLLVFNIVVLLLIGLVLPQVAVGWSVVWAAVVLTAASLWIKPLITTWFRGMAGRSAGQRTKMGEKVVQFFLVLLVAYIIWVFTVIFSGVNVHGWFWGYVIPPLLLMVAWAIYDVVDDRIEGHAGRLYDRATNRSADAASVAPSSATVASPTVTRAARQEVQDGLTPEQRRMFDELGKS
ncbi:hypothetical protein [Microbacterium sp. P02]|uniref:hypothetical protein n=1 Tax=unclassified Microbacterium TaxID=2609290 RepID=UPI00366DE72E